MALIPANSLISQVDLAIKGIQSCPNCQKPGVCQNRNPLCQCFADYVNEASNKFVYQCQKFRYGHICKYFLTHKHDVFSILSTSDSDILQHLGTPTNLTCSSIGGGPGSDYVGVLEWLSQSAISANLRTLIYNNCDFPVWAPQFAAIQQYYEPAFIRQASSITPQSQLVSHITKGKIVVASYVMNEWRKEGCSHQKAAKKILKYLDLPAVLALNDFNDSANLNCSFFVGIERELTAMATVRRTKFVALNSLHCSDSYPDQLRTIYKPTLKSNSLQMLLLVS